MDILNAIIDPFLLTVLFGSIFFGFSCSFWALFMLDSRVFDENGQQLPGPSHLLWGKNYFLLSRLTRRTRQYSRVVYEIFLSGFGDGSIVALKSPFGKPSIIVAHPDLVKSIMSGHHMKFLKDERLDNMKYIFGESLCTCEDRVWPRYRNALLHMFRSRALKNAIGVFNLHSRRLLRHWHFRINKASLDSLESSEAPSIFVYLDEDFRNLVTGVMFEACFGFDFFVRKQNKKVAEDFQTIMTEYKLCLGNITTSSSYSSNSMNSILDWLGWFSKRKKAVRNAVRDLKDIIKAEIVERNDRKCTLTPSDKSSSRASDYLPQYNHSASSSEDGSAPRDLLGFLLESNEDVHEYQRLGVSEICDHIFSFLILGYENTAATLTWMLYELCLKSDIQRQCAEEARSIMTVNGVHTSAVVFDDIAKFSLLIQVLKETLRLHPPVPSIHRKCSTSCRLGEYSLRPGANVSISVLALHRHPDFWYLPNQFFPERFSQENIPETIKNPFQYIPFGGGSRNCIGQRFAQMALIVTTAVLLSKYEFTLLPEDANKVHFDEAASYIPINLRVKISERAHSERSPWAAENNSSSRF